MKKIVLYSSTCLFVDQVIKIMIETFFSLYQEVVVLKNFFLFTYVKNYGAAFSLFDGNRILFILIAFVALFFFYFFFLKNKNLTRMEIGVYSFFIGGIMGNLIDRIFRGYVVDYLSFTIFHYSFPVFNFADICIVLSTVCMVWFVGKEERYGNNYCNGEGKKN